MWLEFVERVLDIRELWKERTRGICIEFPLVFDWASVFTWAQWSSTVWEKEQLMRICKLNRGFPGGASGKEPTCQCRRRKRREFKILWRRPWQPTLVFLPGESHGQRILAAIVCRVTKSWTWQKRLSTHTHNLNKSKSWCKARTNSYSH